ncbi:hypothetical protein ACTFIV_005737 [Dictyostelium citrinum]
MPSNSFNNQKNTNTNKSTRDLKKKKSSKFNLFIYIKTCISKNDFNNSISMNKINESIKTSDIDIFNNNTLSSCNNTPQPSPYHQTRFNQPDFFEEIKREDDIRLLAYSL